MMHQVSKHRFFSLQGNILAFRTLRLSGPVHFDMLIEHYRMQCWWYGGVYLDKVDL